MDPATHKRFLEYRARYAYWGKETRKAILTAAEFEAADAEQRALDARGEGRSDEEEQRFAELNAMLFRD